VGFPLNTWYHFGINLLTPSKLQVIIEKQLPAANGRLLVKNNRKRTRPAFENAGFYNPNRSLKILLL